MEKKISISIPEEMLELVEEMCEKTGWSRSAVVKTMMSFGVPKMNKFTEWLEKRE